jgi:negative regulator of flagellin synthesis FlgM
MSSIDTRSSFFPRTRNVQAEPTIESGKVSEIKTNSAERATELSNKTSSDAKVSIPEGVKDFSKIKKNRHVGP